MARAAISNRATAPIVQNLLLRSEDFSHAAWTKRGTCTITANQIANPVNGAVDADMITNMGQSLNDMYVANYAAQIGGGGRVYTPSFWVKRISTTGRLQISNPTTGTPNGNWLIDFSLIGADWVRIVPGVTGLTIATPFTLTTHTSNWGRGGIILNAETTNLDFYMWGAQQVVASWAGPYIQTVGSTVNTGPLRNLAASRATPAQTQNLLTYSNAYDTVAAWNNTNVTIGANTSDTTDYLGTNTAEKFTDSSDGGATAHYVSRAIAVGTVRNGTACVYSVIAKKGTKNYVVLVNNDGSIKGCFNLNTGAVGTVSGGTADMTSLGGGWYLCKLYATWNDSLNLFGILIATVDNQLSYTGDGTGTLYIGNSQLVNANRLGNYGVVTGAAATTTPIRNAA